MCMYIYIYVHTCVCVCEAGYIIRISLHKSNKCMGPTHDIMNPADEASDVMGSSLRSPTVPLFENCIFPKLLPSGCCRSTD